MRNDLTAAIAEYVVATHATDLPAAVGDETTRSVFNVLGCALGGARHPVTTLLERTLAPFAGAPQATLFGRGRKTDILHAAMINCLASSVHSFDDTHAEAVIHPAGPVATAALALAERHAVSGQRLLTAIALGIEFACRLCKAVSVPPAKGPVAWSGTGIAGGFGAAIAAGHMLGLDVPTMRSAIGIALANAAGLRAMHGSMMTPVMPAQAAQTGLRSALLAREGFTGGTNALEHRYGFLGVFAEIPNPDALAGDLGARFEVLKNTYKPYPCGIVIHPIIDACLALRQPPGLTPERIARVDVSASAGAMALCNNRNPQDELQAHVSLHHWVAVAFLRGTARIVDMDTDTAVRDPGLIAFQDRVEATLDPGLANDAAIVTLTLTDGATHRHHIPHARGSAARPMTNTELTAKFHDLAEPVIGANRTREVIARAWAMADAPDAGDLGRALA